MAKRRQIYAVYRGEDNLGDGTAEELAQKLKINKKTIYNSATRSPKPAARLVVIKLDKEAI